MVGQDAGPPHATVHLLSDLKMLSAYDTAKKWVQPKAQQLAFNAFTWEDKKVSKALPEYLSASAEEKQRVEFAFKHLVPTPADPADAQQTQMHNWLKSRLFTYDKDFPFEY